MKEQVKGGIKTEIKPKHILPLEIYLPDIEEQINIANHFSHYENEIDELADEITHQQTLLKKLRQSILQEAVKGKLNKEWREENPEVEPASKLLERIREEKEKLIKEKKSENRNPCCRSRPMKSHLIYRRAGRGAGWGK